jgi:putative spermidine/putrescine transport system ATP-binding protein
MYRLPGNPFVANFIGVTNAFDGQLKEQTNEHSTALFGNIALNGVFRSADQVCTKGTSVKGAIRAEQIRIADAQSKLVDLDAQFEGTVSDVIFEGDRLLYEVSVPVLGDQPIRIFHHDQNNFATHELGGTVHIRWKSRDLHIFVAR